MTTEIALLKLKPDIDISTGEAKTVWAESLTTVLSQPGAQRAYYGSVSYPPMPPTS